MKTLTREEVRRVIEGRGAAPRVPLTFDHWMNNNIFHDSQQEREAWLSKYPCDVQFFEIAMPDLLKAPADDPNYRWTGVDMEENASVGIDHRTLIEDWESEEADIFFDTFPSAEYPGLVPDFQWDGVRYVQARWWFCFFERLWSIRGMQNALTDFYMYPDEVHKLFQMLADFYCRMMERVCEKHHVDGFFVSDDIGTQQSAFFSVALFREFFKPYYKQIIDKAHSLGCHFWLHSCGNIEAFIPEFIEIGLDVLHPIQKYTMDEREIARKYGDQICFWAGFDVQQTIPYGTEEDVRQEARFMIDAYWRPEGRFMLTFGNASTLDWKMSCLDALYEESIAYGTEKAAASQTM